jgi:hypothetical protein
MDLKKTLNILTKDIRDIEKIVSNYENYSEIPPIEIDLVLSKVRNLYDSLLIFRKTITETINTDDIKIDNQTKPGVKAKEDTFSDKVGQPEDKELIEVEEDKTMDSADETKTSADISQDLSKEKTKADTKDIKKEPETLADLFQNSKSYRHEKLAEEKPVKNLSSKLQSEPIPDIGSAIGLNDKFLFINELFNGNIEKYEETISFLNNAPNFNDAFNYLNEHFNWEMESLSVQKLLNLVRRKLIINQNE